MTYVLLPWMATLLVQILNLHQQGLHQQGSVTTLCGHPIIHILNMIYDVQNKEKNRIRCM